ncbi:MAG TPA: hypothetical protein VFF43_22580, partial [Caldimonas sp.]|nr:hypothetical protein [Caldimonas sp.]
AADAHAQRSEHLDTQRSGRPAFADERHEAGTDLPAAHIEPQVLERGRFRPQQETIVALMDERDRFGSRLRCCAVEVDRDGALRLLRAAREYDGRVDTCGRVEQRVEAVTGSDDRFACRARRRFPLAARDRACGARQQHRRDLLAAARALEHADGARAQDIRPIDIAFRERALRESMLDVGQDEHVAWIACAFGGVERFFGGIDVAAHETEHTSLLVRARDHRGRPDVLRLREQSIGRALGIVDIAEQRLRVHDVAERRQTRHALARRFLELERAFVHRETSVDITAPEMRDRCVVEDEPMRSMVAAADD